MKIICILLSILISALTINAQDKEPTMQPISYFVNSSLYTGAMNPNHFKQDKFLLGWHWGAYPKMTEALGMNMNQGSENSFDNKDNNNNVYTFKPESTKIQKAIIGPYQIEVPWHAQSFQYEPTLLKISGQEENVNVRTDESVPAIFGFVEIHENTDITQKIIDASVTGKNKYLLGLHKDNFESTDFTNGECKILSGNWPNSFFRGRFDYVPEDEKDPKSKELYKPILSENDYNGKREPTELEYQYCGAEWFLTINLKRADLTSTGRNDNKVLKLKIKSRILDSKNGEIRNNNYEDIKFEALPNSTNPATISVNHFGENELPPIFRTLS